jgi:hypothetical protein
MVDAVVLVDFTENGTLHRKGDRVTLSKADYDRLVKQGFIGPTGGSSRHDI